jgi:hypothetical protein
MGLEDDHIVEMIRRSAGPTTQQPQPQTVAALASSTLCLNLLAEISRALTRIDARLDEMARHIGQLSERRPISRPLADTWPSRS